MLTTLFRLIVFLLLFYPLPIMSAEAAGKQVIILETMPVHVILEGSAVFQETLHIIRDSVDFRVLKADGDPDRATHLLKNALAEKTPDLVVAIATLGSQSAHQLLKDTDIPWLFFTVTDPVGAGIVAQINQPSGTNVSGLVYGIERKTKLDMALRLVKDVSSQRPLRIGFIHTDYPSSLGDKGMLQEAIDDHPDFSFVPYQIVYQPVPEKLPEMLDQVREATRKLAGQVDYWWTPVGPLGERDEYVKLLVEETEQPVLMATNLRGPQLGALLYLGPDIPGQAREVAALADSVLSGKDAGSIPITMPKAFAVGLNLTTASRLGIVIPADILDIAGGNVYR